MKTYWNQPHTWHCKTSTNSHLFTLLCQFSKAASSEVGMWGWIFVLQMKPWIKKVLLLVISSHKTGVCAREARQWACRFICVVCGLSCRTLLGSFAREHATREKITKIHSCNRWRFPLTHPSNPLLPPLALCRASRSALKLPEDSYHFMAPGESWACWRCLELLVSWASSVD